MSKGICELLEEYFPPVLCPLILEFMGNAEKCHIAASEDIQRRVCYFARQHTLPWLEDRFGTRHLTLNGKMQSTRERLFYIFGLVYLIYLIEGRSYEEFHRLHIKRQKELKYTSASFLAFKTQMHALYMYVHNDEKELILHDAADFRHVFWVNTQHRPRTSVSAFAKKLFQLSPSELPTHLYTYNYWLTHNGHYEVETLIEKNITCMYVKCYTDVDRWDIHQRTFDSKVTIYNQLNYREEGIINLLRNENLSDTEELSFVYSYYADVINVALNIITNTFFMQNPRE